MTSSVALIAFHRNAEPSDSILAMLPCWVAPCTAFRAKSARTNPDVNTLDTTNKLEICKIHDKYYNMIVRF
jgi:hypothetical protein